MQLLMMTQAVDLDNPVLGFTHQWINMLAQHFEHVHVISRLAGRMELVSNVTVYPYSSPNQKDIPLQRHLFFNRTLGRLILGRHVDTIFIHMIPKWVMMANRYRQFRNIPMSLWYTHVSPDPKLFEAHQIVTHGITAIPESYHYFDKKVSALGHGIDTELFKPASDNQQKRPFTIIMVGRLSAIKKVDLLIESLNELKGKLPFQCKIVGGPATEADDRYVQKLHELVKTCQLEKEVAFVGPIPFTEVQKVYQASDLLINLTDANSFDKTVLEAMACQLPVITSNPSFFPILSKHNSNFILRDGEKKALADQIYQIANMTKDKKTILKQALRQEVIDNHNLQKLISNIAHILKDQGKK